ncbi:MAG: succinate dehydrogenase, cytochrome b556 subunit [Elusimicrobia bacterium RIFCSPLOWO2_02_FULL_39_32]|nr:MAG: succinate dehydrogenase, cytochrome b556 subunit [Elusimicrobia bacterium GWA2_38_7]OGR80575.1 MAG: succinate dehydrogenase, cytochrome b556 subunit [Elusimicrobia bacterium RIFCSPHIGHO2_02_FULL_39_36]OGR91257.1 MAG: succinate dehydrogenase, cytochrome b556 subunit [Elusimicrobia bacterium RIFCSPLOWO2_02_FULL_39_32]OGS00631.1 MAG: succinate dehydrogenase, cytochrome b556 subunit [Elusimicrobia bacterium RIFCSPLOWO2_12_FULL_39_28]
MIYKGKEGQWSWIFHRITGIGVLLFLAIHIIDTMLIGWGPEIYNKVIAIYRNPIFKIGEVGLFAAVLYHALNGIRIILIDFIPETTKYHRQIFYVEMLLFFLAMIPVSFLMLSH